MRLTHSGVLALAAVLAGSATLNAQETPAAKDSLGWHRKIVSQLNLTQASFDNWAQGGENALAWQMTGKARFNYRAPRYRWTNSAGLDYGQTRLGGQSFRKSSDEISMESVLSYDGPEILSPYVSVSALTQIARGYHYEDSTAVATSDFMDPGYFTQSVGLSWTPSDAFTTRGGAALKETVTHHFPQYVDNPNTTEVERSRVEPGLNSVTELNQAIDDNLLLSSKLELFSNLKAFDQIDVNWASSITAKVSSYINVNLNVRVLYDRDVSRARQLKQALAMGLSYTFLMD